MDGLQRLEKDQVSRVKVIAIPDETSRAVLHVVCSDAHSIAHACINRLFLLMFKFNLNFSCRGAGGSYYGLEDTQKRINSRTLDHDVSSCHETISH